MSITLADIRKLVKLLGSRGASAGLKASELISLDQVKELARKAHSKLEETDDRDQLIDSLIEDISRAGLKPIDDLMKMTFDELLEYFDSVRAPNEELLKLMKELNYKVGSEDKKHLRKYVARQISETALFARVAGREGR